MSLINICRLELPSTLGDNHELINIFENPDCVVALLFAAGKPCF